MNLADRYALFNLERKCRSFKASGVDPEVVKEWFDLFPPKFHKLARKFLAHIKYFPTSTVDRSIINQGTALMKRLAADGIKPSEILVVQIDGLGSSAAKALSTFRKSVPGGTSCAYYQADDKGIYNYSTEMPVKAVIYLDDFIGTGTQVGEAREHVVGSLGVAVPEHVVAFAVLEEAHEDLERECSLRCEYVHPPQERPLRPECTGFSDVERERLLAINSSIRPRQSMGFGGRASMIVLGDGVPDNCPALLREALFAKFG